MTAATPREPATTRAPRVRKPTDHELAGTRPSRAKAVASKRVTATDERLARFEPLDMDAEPDLPDTTSPLFVLDGVEHRIPTHPSAALALDYIQRRSQTGGDASVWLLAQLLGEESFAALTSPAGRRKLSGKNLSRLIDLAVGITVGALEDDDTGPLGRG